MATVLLDKPHVHVHVLLLGICLASMAMLAQPSAAQGSPMQMAAALAGNPLAAATYPSQDPSALSEPLVGSLTPESIHVDIFNPKPRIPLWTVKPKFLAWPWAQHPPPQPP
jgi:hypothetical protein